MFKKILIFITTILLAWTSIFPTKISASENPSFVTPVFPIRGQDFWPYQTDSTQTPFINFQHYTKLIYQNNLSATWLFRYDALLDNKIYTTARLFPPNQERGLFLEITPKLTTNAQVKYPKGENWSDSNRIFISGYTLEDRKKLINTALNQFLKVYGHYPKTIGAWHIDAWSANYLQKHYGITTILICSDQYSTDQYQLWGGWWGIPYYSSKSNILIPAQTINNKLPVTVVHWAARDPIRGYGGSVQQSTHSVQANDYLLHKLDTQYFEQLLKTYTQIGNNQFGFLLIGIENDYDWNQYKNEIGNQLSTINKRQKSGQLTTLTLQEFATWYQEKFPNISPNHIISSTVGNQTTTWEMTPQYRIGWKKETLRHPRGGQQDSLGVDESTTEITIFDYRIYNQKFAEPYLETKNQFRQLNLVAPAVIDTVTFPKQQFQTNKEGLQKLRHPLSPKLPFQPNIKTIILWYSTLIIGILIILRKKLKLAIFIILGSTTISLPMIKSGLLYPYGMGFWGPNGHDGIWHLSLIEHFSKNWNLNSPILANTQLGNYHFMFDILTAIVNLLTPTVSSITLYFQIIPPLFAILIGWLTYSFMYQWNKSRTSAYLALLLIYFGGGFGWIITWIRTKSIGGESMFWSTQAISTLINPPFALSLILLLIGLKLFIKYQKHKSPTYKLLIITSIIFGFLIHAKVYAGIIALIGLAIISFIELLPKLSNKFIHKHTNYRTLITKLPFTKLLIITSLITLITFLPLIKLSSTLIQWNPLWFPHTMLQFNDRFFWPKLSQALQAYWATGNWIKAILAEGLAITIFYIGNLGIRIIGILFIIKTIINHFKKITTNVQNQQITKFLITITIVSLAIPLLFTQKGTPWNTIQFLYYGLFFMSLFTAKILGEWIDAKTSNMAKIIVFLIIFVINIPTTYGTLKQYLPYRAPSRIPYEELSALEFLHQQPPGRVLTYPFDTNKTKLYEAPKPLAYYVSTAYVSALSAHPTYLEDEINLKITNLPWKTKRQKAIQIFSTLNEKTALQFVQQNQIEYLYLLKNQSLNLHPNQLGMYKIFDNGLVTIYRKTKTP